MFCFKELCADKTASVLNLTVKDVTTAQIIAVLFYHIYTMLLNEDFKVNLRLIMFSEVLKLSVERKMFEALFILNLAFSLYVLRHILIVYTSLYKDFF